MHVLALSMLYAVYTVVLDANMFATVSEHYFLLYVLP